MCQSPPVSTRMCLVPGRRGHGDDEVEADEVESICTDHGPGHGTGTGTGNWKRTKVQA